MYDFEQKLAIFSNVILSQASKKRDEILDNHKEIKDSELKKYEENCKNDYDKMVEIKINDIKNEYSREYAKNVFELKKELFIYRENIIDDVFNTAKDEFLKFKNTDEYAKYMNKIISLAKTELNAQKVQITLDSEDEKLVDELKKDFDAEFVLEKGIVGGAIIVNTLTNKCIDSSVAKKFSDLRENFLEKNRFSIY